MVVFLTGMILVTLFRTSAGSNIECFNKFECVNDTITTDDDDIDCYGFGSCLSSSITGKDGNIDDYVDIECRGLRSCQNSIYTINKKNNNNNDGYQIWNRITGYLGLAFAKQVSIDSHENPLLQCDGEASCYGIKSIVDTKSISCSGTVLYLR